MAQVKREMARPMPIRLQLNNEQRHRLDLAEAESGEDYDSRLDECATPMSVASAAQRDWNAAVSYADSDVLNRDDLQSPGMVPPMSPGPQADKDVVLFEGAEGGESSPSRSLALTPSSRSGMSRRVSAPNPQAVRPLRIGRAMSLATPGEPADQFDPSLASMRTPPSVGRDVDPSAGTPASLADSNSPQEDSGGAAGSGGAKQFKTAYTFQRPNNGAHAINASAARAAAAAIAAGGGGGGGGGELEEPIPLTPSSMAASRSLHDKKKHRPLLRVAVGKGRQRRHDQHARQELGEALAGEDYDSTLEDCGTPMAACDDFDPECGTPCSFAPDDMDTRSDC